MTQASLRYTPEISPRYWAAIMLASMCGTNLGDFFPDLLRMSPEGELAVLAASFAGLRMIEALVPQGFEAVYWMSILVVRAAATAIADFLIDVDHFGFVAGGARVAAVMSALLAVYHASRRSKTDKSPIDAVYWVTMLTAGTLGTILGDGIGHAFPSVKIGVPVSAALASISLALILQSGSGRPWTQGIRYWVAIVAVRWWGTNTGDIAKFLATLPVSMTVTGLAMAILLLRWKEQEAPQRFPPISFE